MSQNMSSAGKRSSRSSDALSEMHVAYTRQRILDAALQVLEESSVGGLTIREVAVHARVSERTIFRYFPTRDDFLDAVASEVRRFLKVPPSPASIEELFALPRALYSGFEAKAKLTRAALHTELFHRLRDAQAKQRWLAIRKLVDGFAANSPEQSRKIAATNIRFFLSASSWHYYRFYFGFSLEGTIACAETAIRDALDGLERTRT